MNAPIESNHLSDENGNPAGGQTIGKGIQIDWQNGPLARAMRERGLKLWPGQVVLETAVNVAEPTPDGSELDQSVAEDAAVAVRWLGPDFGEETP